MNLNIENNFISKFLLLFVPALIIGKLILSIPFLALFGMLVLFLLLVLINKPLMALCLFILLLPYTNTVYFGTSYINIPGAKPLNFLAGLIIAISALNYSKATGINNRIIFFIIILFLLLFSISIFRAIEHLNIINSVRAEKLSKARFLLSDYVKPLIYFMPLIVIIFFTNKKEDLKILVKCLTYTTFIFSAILIFLLFFKLGAIKNVEKVGDYYKSIFFMHRNDIANFYIIAVPLLLSTFFMKKNIFNIINLALAILVIGFLYSRTAYLTLILSILIFLVVSKRVKFLPIFIVVAIVISFFVAGSIVERAEKGLRSKDLNEIFAGRVNDIWLPLIYEYKDNPEKLIFGNGRYGILTSKAASKSIILEVEHPHNMYLELILDVGIIGFAIIMIPLFLMLKGAINNRKNIIDSEILEYQYGVIVSVMAYLIAGITGRSLFPELTNSFLWIIIGLQIVIFKLQKLKSFQFEYNA